jgi:nitroreductase
MVALLAKTGILSSARGLRDYIYDFNRFRRHSTALDPHVSPAAERAQLTKIYHRIEKGLALPEPRIGFGRDTVTDTMARISRLEGMGEAGFETEGARGSLASYVAFHTARAHPVDADLEDFLAAAPQTERPGGVVTLKREKLAAATAMDFDGFARSRYSVRQYTGEPVTQEEIEAAVATALKSPCVCNRESRHVFAAFGEKTRTRLLAYQNGNRGFGHLAGAVLVVAVDQRSFSDFGERNQGWIDGGLFTMSLVYALHARQLGTCLLNWSVLSPHDASFRAEFDIPDHMNVITMMAVGRLPETITAAQSPRPGVPDVLHVLG